MPFLHVLIIDAGAYGVDPANIKLIRRCDWLINLFFIILILMLVANTQSILFVYSICRS